MLRTGLTEEPGNCFRPGRLRCKWLQVGETSATLTVFNCIYLPVPSNAAEAFSREQVVEAEAEVVNHIGSVVSVHKPFLWFLTNAPWISDEMHFELVGFKRVSW